MEGGVAVDEAGEGAETDHAGSHTPEAGVWTSLQMEGAKQQSDMM